MPLAYIALGSNLGDRLGQMRQALALLEAGHGLHLIRTSPVYQNPAVGMGPDAGDFLNAAVTVETQLGALPLLNACLAVERQLGRRRKSQGPQPRTIDLDLLFYGRLALQTQTLTLPHPRIAERAFVAVPLAQIAPELELGGVALSVLAEQIPREELQLTDHTLLPLPQ